MRVLPVRRAPKDRHPSEVFALHLLFRHLDNTCGKMTSGAPLIFPLPRCEAAP